MSFSLSVWFKCTGNWNANQSIVNNAYNTSGSWDCFVNAPGPEAVGRIFFSITLETGGLVEVWNETATDWNHAVLTYDGNQTIAYVNGVKGETSDVCCNREMNTGQTQVTIGQFGESVSGDTYFDGLIDEVRIYSHTLSESHVYDLYNNPCT